ncbi:MAG: acyl-CoA carboxylase subunit beta [Magnetococcales bacterium]|nr:acyl-CoA carboxylase subunit beta [Magnetococcales bacterium]
MKLFSKATKTLMQHRKLINAAGGDKKTEARNKKGILTARQRLLELFQPGTFQEYGAHMRHSCTNFGMEGKVVPADGVVVGSGFIDGRQVAAISQDFTTMAGTVGKVHAQKIVTVMEYAQKMGIPIIAFKDSGGARIQEGVDALSGYGSIFYQNVNISGVVPQIAIISGPCAGGAAYSPALMDFVIMTQKNAHMFITGPQVIKSVSGVECSMDDVGSPEMHASISGNVHFLAEDDEHAIQIAKHLLEFLPCNNSQDPPHRPFTETHMEGDPGMDRLVPDNPKAPIDILRLIERIVDKGDFLEIHAAFARNIVVGFGRIHGIVSGIIANQSSEKAGCLDIDASDKAARFIRFCNAFNIPLVTLVDVPGFLPGIEQERGGIIRHGAKLLFAYAASTVPKITVILRKAYGGAYIAMNSPELGADAVYAWPIAEIAVMGAEGAVNILHRKELKDVENEKERAEELAQEYRDNFSNPYLAASRGYLTDIIEPSQTRSIIAASLQRMLQKRELRPHKKHGNIPL